MTPHRRHSPVLLLLALMMLAGVALAAAPTREVLVVDAGHHSTVIVLAAQPTSSAQYAALELQYHFRKITGEQVPIAHEPHVPAAPVKIAVGNTVLGKGLGFPVDSLKPWEFLVGEKNGAIVLAGGDDPSTEKADWNSLNLVFNGKPNGTCRAVYEFLEQCCNVHWYLPSEAGMTYPHTKRLLARMGPTIRRSTDFRSTSFYPYQVNGKMFCQPSTPKLTGDNVPDSDREKWRRHLWTIPVTTRDMLPVTEVQRWLLRNKVGGERYGPNHSFGKWLAQHGEQHPDWFSYKSKARIEQMLAKGPKEAEREFQATGEPCLTAPGVFEQEVKNARAYLDQQPRLSRFFPIVPNDNYVWCQCPTCLPLYNRPVVDCPLWGGATGKASYYVWNFVNRVARAIRQTNPDGWVAGIAYHDYMAPPRNFTLEPNVAVTICTYLGDWTPALRDTAAGLVKAWRDQAKCQWIGLWEYFCYDAMSQYQPMFPKVCPHLMGEDVKRMHQLGVKAEFLETEDTYRFQDAPNRGWAVWSNPIWLYLNVWIRFKLWDDCSQNVNTLLQEHYHNFYGPAAGPISKFFGRIEDRVTDMSLRGPKTFNDVGGNRQADDFAYLFPPAVMKELRGYINQATALAKAEPYKTRVGWVRDGFLVPQERAEARYLARQKATPATKPPEAVCYRLPAAPQIDGQTGDPAWRGQPIYYLNDWRTGAKPKTPTWFRLGYDDSNLYLLVRCEDPNVAKLRAACRQRDGAVYLDDCVELHLTFARDRGTRYQILVNSRGVVQDFRHSINEAGMDTNDLSWNCAGLQTAATTDAHGWTVEMKVPLASVGGQAEADAFYANIAREKYSASDDAQPDELQSWGATQSGFADGKYFGKVLLAGRDAWHAFFNEQTPAPKPVLYRVDSKHPWTVTPGAIQATEQENRLQVNMQCPQVEAKGRTYGGFQVKADPPADVTAAPRLEVVFTKPDPDVMLELIYNYQAADGKDYSNYFVLSTFGDSSRTPQVFVRDLSGGMQANRPAPKLLKSVTIYGVVSGAKTPTKADYSVQWVRLCDKALREE